MGLADEDLDKEYGAEDYGAEDEDLCIGEYGDEELLGLDGWN